MAANTDFKPPAVRVLPDDLLAFDPLDINTQIEDVSALIVLPPLTEPACQIKRDKKVDENRVVRGSTLAKQIDKITQTILKETDCVALQQKIKKELNSLRDEIAGSTEEVRKKLDEILPVLSLPLNPFQIPKWLKKLAIGRILPDLEATIDLIKRITEVIIALTELLAAVQDVIPRLEACAISTRDQLKQDFENAIDETVEELRKDIENAVAEAICKGLNDAGISADDIENVLSGVKSIGGLIDSFDQFKDTINQQLGSDIQKIGQKQAAIQSITGIPPVIDTTSIDTFIETSSSPEYEAYKKSVIEVLSTPAPVSNTAPVVTGTAAVSSLLTCSNGTWTANGVTNTFQYSFQWMRESVEIYGANTYQYTTVQDDAGYPIYCIVRAENQVNIEEAQSNIINIPGTGYTGSGSGYTGSAGAPGPAGYTGSQGGFTGTVTGGVTFDSIVLQNTATLSTSSVSTVSLVEFPVATYRSASFTIQAVSGMEAHLTRFLATSNSSTIIATEFGTVISGSSLFTVDVDISGSNARIRVTPSSSSPTTFKSFYDLITT